MQTFNEYQDWTGSTAIYPKDQALTYLALGLTGEAGEVADKIKKSIRDGGFLASDLIPELGDVLWYLARLAEELDYDLSEVASANHNKLESRKARGVIGGSGDDR